MLKITRKNCIFRISSGDFGKLSLIPEESSRISAVLQVKKAYVYPQEL